MNVATTQPRNGYNQYYFALDSTFSRPIVNKTEVKMPEAEAKIWARGLNIIETHTYTHHRIMHDLDKS